MKTAFLKNSALWLTASLLVSGAAQAADPASHPAAAGRPPVANLPMGGAFPQMAATCPAPYNKDTSGFDTSKGEFECIKTAATCPDAYDSHRNDMTGQLTCTLKQIPPSPLGWAPGSGNGTIVYESIPQPFINCPKSTPTWPWGTSYWKDSWNRMGCRANLKPAS